jgi:chromosome segregation ATPase
MASKNVPARVMNAVSIITAFLLVVISGGSSLAQNNAQAPAGSNAAQAQTEERSSAKQFDDLRHSRISAVNAISKLSQIKQAQEQSLSSTQDQEKLLEKRLSSVGDPPRSKEEWERQLNAVKGTQKDVSDALSAAKAATPPDQKAIDNLESQLGSVTSYIEETESRRDEADKQIQQYNTTKDDLKSQNYKSNIGHYYRSSQV